MVDMLQEFIVIMMDKYYKLYGRLMMIHVVVIESPSNV